MKKKKNRTLQLTPARRRIFIAATISLPLVFFVCLELGLRWFNYGPNLSLFGHQEIRGEVYTVMNPDVKFRYFGSMQFTPATSLHYFLVPKPPAVYRVFCLGGSTTCGYPYYFNASFSSFLKDRLNAIFPDKNVEIINLGMTATNSFTALDVARELPQYHPDLIIDYDGHNEFYGALGVASNQSTGSSRFATLLYLRMIHLRTFLLMRNAVFKIAGLFGQIDNSVSRGTMMETLALGQEVTYESPVYRAAYATFRENLQDLKEHCLSAGIPLILGTQVSNLRDQPPLGSENSTAPGQQRSLFQQWYNGGVELQSKRSIDSAIVSFQSAIGVDSLCADAHYRLAECLEAKGRSQEALSEYILARDYDALRFRTDTKFNNLIRSMEDHEHCFVADIEATFKSLSEDSLIGHNLTIDHLHPNLGGYFILAKTIAQVMHNNGLLASRQDWNSADTINENELWENRSVTDLDEQAGIQSVKVITSGWPFKKQSATIEFVPPTDTLNQIAHNLAIGKLGWMDAHLQAINFYRQRGDWTNVQWEYKTIIDLYPHIIQLYMDLASVDFNQRHFDDMKAILLRSLKISPTLAAYSALGNIMLDKGDPVGALKYFEQMDNFPQDPHERLQNEFRISYAYAKAGKFEKAKARLGELLQMKPDFRPAIQLLADINRQLDNSQSTVK
jgi:tetratricopeptide (TPR) repeat protein